ncbi:MAG: hypothetical protein U1F43_11085 [Myxococcota bacterium]
MTLLRLGPVPARVVARATAFPSDPIDTPTLLARLAPGLPPARRDALLAYLRAEVGVEQRAFVQGGERALDLAVRAAQGALGQGPFQIAAHVHATSTPSRWTGPEAARIGQALGLDAAFFDVRSGCTGGLWALHHGARLAAESGACVLVTAADAFSQAFDPDERMLPLAMGDGAAPLVLAPPRDDASAPAGGIVKALFGGRPALADLATVRAELPGRGEPLVLGGDPAAFGDAAEAALKEAWAALAAPDDATVIIQTGRAGTARRVHARAELASLARHGNIGAASALVAWCELAPDAARSVAFASAGGGLSFGALWWREA